MGLKLYLEKLSDNIKAETAVLRATFNNTTNQGSGFEVVLRNLISSYLPSNNIVTHGEIIDTFNIQSGQIDIAVAHEFHPKGYSDGRPTLLLYDLVTAIGEAKVLLNTKHLDLSISSASFLDKFKRHKENNNLLAGDFYGNVDNDQKPPPYFLIGLNCNIGYNKIIKSIDKTNVSLVVSLEHSTSKKGLIVLGDTHRNADVIKMLDSLGVRKKDYLWESENAVLALIWCLNYFYVPYISLTNVLPLYFEP